MLQSKGNQWLNGQQNKTHILPTRLSLKSTSNHFKSTDTHKLKVKGLEKRFHENGNKTKQAGAAISMQEKPDFKTNALTGDKEGPRKSTSKYETKENQNTTLRGCVHSYVYCSIVFHSSSMVTFPGISMVYLFFHLTYSINILIFKLNFFYKHIIGPFFCLQTLRTTLNKVRITFSGEKIF